MYLTRRNNITLKTHSLPFPWKASHRRVGRFESDIHLIELLPDITKHSPLLHHLPDHVMLQPCALSLSSLGISPSACAALVPVRDSCDSVTRWVTLVRRLVEAGFHSGVFPGHQRRSVSFQQRTNLQLLLEANQATAETSVSVSGSLQVFHVVWLSLAWSSFSYTAVTLIFILAWDDLNDDLLGQRKLEPFPAWPFGELLEALSVRL